MNKITENESAMQIHGQDQAGSRVDNDGITPSTVTSFPETKVSELDAKKTSLGYGDLPWPNFNLLQLTDVSDTTKYSSIIELKNEYKAHQSILEPSALNKTEDPCKDFNLEKLPPILRDYIKALSKSATNAHPIMLTCSAIAAISGLIGTRVFIPKTTGNGDGYYQKLYTNLWFLVIANSGAYKSSALNSGTTIASKKQSKIYEEISILEGQLKHEKDEERKQEIKEIIQALELSNPLLPTRITAEALLELLGLGAKGLIVTSEFGAWLQYLAKNHNLDLMGILTDLYDVPALWRNVTKNQGKNTLKEPYISIIGVSTLAWLKSNLKMAHIEGGFGARLLIYTPAHSDVIPPGLPGKIDPELIKAQDNFEKKIDHLMSHIDQKEIAFTLTPETQKLFSDSEKEIGFHYIIKRFARGKDALDSYASRWSPTLLKLSMIMQLLYDIESGNYPGIIGVKAVQAAVNLIYPAIKSTSNLLAGEFSESAEEEEVRKFYEWICKKAMEKGRPVTMKEILQSRKVKGKSPEYKKVIEFLEDSGKIERINAGQAMGVCFKPIDQNLAG